MTINLLRMAVRIESAAHLKEVQAERSIGGNEKKNFLPLREMFRNGLMNFWVGDLFIG